MTQGKVKWFNNEKGYGFITGDDGKDYFAHFRSISMDGFKTLSMGDRVEFEPASNEKGDYADKIKKV